MAEENRLRWLDCLHDNEKLKEELGNVQDENKSLKQRQDLIRKMFDKERAARIKAENELEQKAKLINSVMDSILSEKQGVKIPEETKLQLSDMRNSFKRPQRPAAYMYDDGRPSIIPEGDTTSSILSDISYSMSEDNNMSEDNLLDFIHKPKDRNRKSGPRKSMRASDVFNEHNKRKRESDNFQNGDRITATASVTFDLQSDKYRVTSASANVDVSPPRKSQRMSQVIVPSLEVIPPTCPSGPSTSSARSSLEDFHNANHEDDNFGLSPTSNMMMAVDQIHARVHSTVPHKCIMPVTCTVCMKRMHYSNSTVKCSQCKAIVHAQCEIKLPLPCVPQVKRKPNQNILANYTPSESPMIPSLIIHCVVEIEKRGLTEEGIYRKSGNSDQVKELKKELLNTETTHKTDQLLSNADIHVVCSTLKDFLRGLDEPLVPISMWHWFTEAANCGDIDDVKARLITAIAALPLPNKETLAYLILHLQRVAESGQSTKMSIDSLSIIFGPCIVGYSSKNPAENCAEIDVVNRTVGHLLNMDSYYWNSLIEEKIGNIQVTPTSYKSIHQTPSTDSLVYRAMSRKNKTTPMLTRTERKKKYFNTPPTFRNN